MAANPSTPPRNSESVIGAEHGAPSGALLVDHSGSASIGKGKKRKETHSKSIKVKLMKAPSTAIPDSSNWDSVAEEVRKRLSNGSDFQQPNVAEEANEPKTNLFKTKMRGTRKGGKDKSPTETKSDLTDTLRICFLTASPSPPLVSDSIHLPSAAGEGAHKGAKALDLQRRSTFTGEDEAQEAEKYWDGVFAVKGEFMHLNYECEDKPQEFSVTDIEVIHRWSTWLAETMRVADILGLSLSAGPGLPALALMKADGTIDLNGMKSALRVGKGAPDFPFVQKRNSCAGYVLRTWFPATLTLRHSGKLCRRARPRTTSSCMLSLTLEFSSMHKETRRPPSTAPLSEFNWEIALEPRGDGTVTVLHDPNTIGLVKVGTGVLNPHLDFTRLIEEKKKTKSSTTDDRLEGVRECLRERNKPDRLRKAPVSLAVATAIRLAPDLMERWHQLQCPTLLFDELRTHEGCPVGVHDSLAALETKPVQGGESRGDVSLCGLLRYAGDPENEKNLKQLHRRLQARYASVSTIPDSSLEEKVGDALIEMDSGASQFLQTKYEKKELERLLKNESLSGSVQKRGLTPQMSPQKSRRRSLSAQRSEKRKDQEITQEVDMHEKQPGDTFENLVAAAGTSHPHLWDNSIMIMSPLYKMYNHYDRNYNHYKAFIMIMILSTNLL
uniref:Uncharacterized protein n=1 Tax=Chromera velia CCMP2878 TaxID=1169474 RepID=A0A0G4HXH9_9ALVE|eukprot:Cvel_1493.t1-p1 / transcript=Cvel_1493.t1 / gene=Cvel_1493 / organism=Chromera_velia_CCMP2878 / gene_product=hypothetical protein / transcript_product=hypothetical protein / location=Cvel_scaffold52:82562-87821(-) / protein_length=666 / sequence_SO=supercontig / SO=protein_coding / is_pseudo=false